MAHEMVRQPSQTPNIDNIDDIIPFRYAYGNQDGYVINKGNELSHTINGSEFRINSGRVVLQGVEDDIDANGVSFSIENIAETRYYVIYYRVNLALNITSYEIDYDTAGYPTIDAGDDLTKNSSGSANLPLYRFTALSGVISGVEKVVKAIEYINKNVTVKNAENINGLPLKENSNAILVNKDLIIPQKKLLWSGNVVVDINYGQQEDIDLKTNLQQGDKIVVEIYQGDVNSSVFVANALGIIGSIPSNSTSNSIYFDVHFLNIDNTKQMFYSPRAELTNTILKFAYRFNAINIYNMSSADRPFQQVIKSIYKIIE